MRVLWLFLFFLPTSICAQELKGQVGVGGFVFPESPLWPDQSSRGAEMFAELEIEGQVDHFDYSLRAFGRWDSEDPERSRLDLREAYVQWSNERWSLLAGVDQVFWGVSESRHLVDIVNQTDLAADMLEEVKLGQPMLKASRQWQNSRLDVFLLPYFRERPFPGRKGRLRPGLLIAQEQPLYESGARERHVDFAGRYAANHERWDIGLSTFRGTQRDPSLLVATDPTGEAYLRPFYGQIKQYALDVQYTNESWLWKMELIRRHGEYDAIQVRASYTALVAGVEYTLFDVSDNTDLGVLAEILYDSRDQRANTPLQRDIFIGARLAINDSTNTAILAGAVVDADNRDSLWRFEASRRLNDRWTAQAKAIFFGPTSPQTPTADLREDSYVSINLIRWF